MRPYTVFLSSSESFQRWRGTENNGIVLLILGWAYVLNATIAEAQGLPLELHQSPSPTQGSSPQGSCTPAPPPANPRVSLDLSYAEPEELEWWKSLNTPGLSVSVVGSQEYLPFSFDVANLGSLDLGADRYSDKTPSSRLPSANRAAEYLQNLSFAYNLGPQSSTALAAALCFRVKRMERTLSVPKPTLATPRNTKTRSNKRLRERYGQVPREFGQMRHYIILGLCNSLLPIALESLFWDPLVLCNHAGHWIRPMRRSLGPAILSEDWELLARTIAHSSAAFSPLWLGVLLCGESPSLIEALEHYAWYGLNTLEFGAWTGIPRSFMSLQPRRRHLVPSAVPRADVWRLRCDLHHRYKDYDYALELMGPYGPFGVMRVADIELEIQRHLLCRHVWVYKH